VQLAEEALNAELVAFQPSLGVVVMLVEISPSIKISHAVLNAVPPLVNIILMAHGHLALLL